MINLLRAQESAEGQKLTFKIVSCETEYTQLVLTWKPAKNRHDPAILPGNHNSHVKAGYRKKSPCELKRDKKRKEQYLIEKGKQQGKDDTRARDMTKHVSVDIQCDIMNETVVSKVTGNSDGPKVTSIVTRSMAKGDSEPERPRDCQDENCFTDVLSPVSVATTPGDQDSPIPHSDNFPDCDNSVDLPHSDRLSVSFNSGNDIVNSFTSTHTVSVVDSLSSDSEDQDPSCSNKNCPYGKPRGDVNKTYYICRKCDYTICTECFLNRRHKRHIEWFEFIK